MLRENGVCSAMRATSLAMLDRQRLASFIGQDCAFEKQFLALLQDTLLVCIASLEEPNADVYSALHAAKAGISVAASEALINSLQLACDLTVHGSQEPFSAETSAAFVQLRLQLLIFRSEIEQVLASEIAP
jgi:hypothetical protein